MRIQLNFYFLSKFQGGVDICAHALFSRGQWEIPLNYYDCDVKSAMFLETLSGREPDLQIY